METLSWLLWVIYSPRSLLLNESDIASSSVWMWMNLTESKAWKCWKCKFLYKLSTFPSFWEGVFHAWTFKLNLHISGEDCFVTLYRDVLMYKSSNNGYNMSNLTGQCAIQGPLFGVKDAQINLSMWIFLFSKSLKIRIS